MNKKEIWYTLEDIKPTESIEELYCLTVDSDDHQFQIGEIGVPTHNSDEAKERQSIKDECLVAIGSIARLGRAAGVHLVVATQRPDVKLIPGEIRANLTTRIGCGPLTSGASLMCFENNSGMRIPSRVKGGVRIAIHGKGQMGQGFFAPPEWIDEFFEQAGGYQTWLSQQDVDESMEVSFEQTQKEQEENPLDDWDECMDNIYEAAGK